MRKSLLPRCFPFRRHPLVSEDHGIGEMDSTAPSAGAEEALTWAALTVAAAAFIEGVFCYPIGNVVDLPSFASSCPQPPTPTPKLRYSLYMNKAFQNLFCPTGLRHQNKHFKWRTYLQTEPTYFEPCSPRCIEECLLKSTRSKHSLSDHKYMFESLFWYTITSKKWRDCYAVRWCFEPSQPQRVISGPKVGWKKMTLNGPGR